VADTKVPKPRTEPKTTKTNELRKHTVRKSLEAMRVHEGHELKEEKARKAKMVVRGPALLHVLVSCLLLP
jgi:hypothetical protein